MLYFVGRDNIFKRSKLIQYITFFNADFEVTDDVLSMKQQFEYLSNSYPVGMTFNLPSYINIPKLYLDYYDDLRKMFKLHPKILKLSDEIIKLAIVEHSVKSPPSAIIGIHVRYNEEYKYHLNILGMKPIGAEYYKRAIAYFREKYDNPLFLVVSDSRKEAEKFVLQPNKHSGN